MSSPPQARDVQARLLANSARGATFLICLQIGSRALTFIVNQILLRYLSPELLGISSQLELYAISVLYFARESIRVALQRQGGSAERTEERAESGNGVAGGKDTADSRAPARKAQEVVNLSYVAVFLGPPLAYVFARLYVNKAGATVLTTPYIHTSLSLYALATILELLIEPCFVIAQQQMLYGLRATAETSATFTRCVVACGLVIWASTSHRELGVLPFALGQLGYALLLNVVYYGGVWKRSTKGGFSLFPALLSPNIPQYFLSLFYKPALTLAVNLYAQSGLKHLLTQGDSLLIALFTTLASQGVYALASNYGSLLARMLFQPIEESSRGVFGRLLAKPGDLTEPSAPPPSNSEKPAADPSPHPSVLSAHTYLLTLLHLYSLLSLFIAVVGPSLAPLLLRYVAGPAWSATSAGAVLAVYCYYIPLLALNGILEAFVSAVATPTQLRAQSAWMLAFSAGFAGAGYVLLRVYDLGAQGLVAANAVNMGMRIVWSWGFVRGYLAGEGVELGVAQCIPSTWSMAMGIGMGSWLRVLEQSLDGNFMDLIKVGVVGGLYGLELLFFERSFLFGCYQMLRPTSSSNTLLSAKKDS